MLKSKTLKKAAALVLAVAISVSAGIGFGNRNKVEAASTGLPTVSGGLYVGTYYIPDFTAFGGINALLLLVQQMAVDNSGIALSSIYYVEVVNNVVSLIDLMETDPTVPPVNSNDSAFTALFDRLEADIEVQINGELKDDGSGNLIVVDEAGAETGLADVTSFLVRADVAGMYKAVEVDENGVYTLTAADDSKKSFALKTSDADLKDMLDAVIALDSAHAQFVTVTIGTTAEDDEVVVDLGATEFVRATHSGDYKVVSRVEYDFTTIIDDGEYTVYTLDGNSGHVRFLFGEADAVLAENLDILIDSNDATLYELFTVTIGGNADDDVIHLAGTVTGETNINVGVEGKDNSQMFDVVITEGTLTGAAGNKVTVWQGAYLNVDSTDAPGQDYNPGGNFLGGVYVMSGGKVRDSAYRGWPLGAGSTFNIAYGGSIAVGGGDRDGRTVLSGLPEAYIYAFDGWLLAPNGTDNAKAVWESVRSEYELSGLVCVTATDVLIYGNFKLQKSMNLPYNVNVGSDATLTIADGVTLELETGRGVYGALAEAAGPLGWTSNSLKKAGELVLGDGAKVTINGADKYTVEGNHSIDSATVTSNTVTATPNSFTFYEFTTAEPVNP